MLASSKQRTGAAHHTAHQKNYGCTRKLSQQAWTSKATASQKHLWLVSGPNK
jgi:hypothetical protein